jgi:hypothetical protein
MDIQIQLTGLEQFLTTVLGPDEGLEGILKELGFDDSQRAALRERHCPFITAGLIEVVRRRLSWEEKDLWFRLLSRRFGLDGEPPASLEDAAKTLGIDAAYASHAEGEALQRCRTKTAQQEFKKEIHRLALEKLQESGAKPERQSVLQKLERLGDLRAAADVARMDYEAKRQAVLQTVQAELDAIEIEFQPVLEAAEGNAAALEAEIKNDVLLRGESLRGGAYQAIYMKGRISWDSVGMNEYARDHPDVLRFRKEGQPSVSLRVAARPSSPEDQTA